MKIGEMRQAAQTAMATHKKTTIAAAVMAVALITLAATLGGGTLTHSVGAKAAEAMTFTAGMATVGAVYGLHMLRKYEDAQNEKRAAS